MDKSYFSFKTLLNFLFPPFCSACEAYLGICAKVPSLCVDCSLKLRYSIEETARVLAAKGDISAFYVLARYGSEPITTLIHKVKYGFSDWAFDPLWPQLARMVERWGWRDVMDGVVAVPLHPSRARERGFNQAALIGEYIARELKIPFYANYLSRVRKTAAQMGIQDQKKRHENVRNAFQSVEVLDLKEKNILLVDDVMTTAATLEACAKCLVAKGARVFAFVLAH